MSAKATDPNTGEEVELSQLTCTACDGPMDGHRCPGASFTVTTGPAPRSGAGVPRGKKADKEKCGHCGAPMHYGLGMGLEDIQCVYMQWSLANGITTDPLARLNKIVPGSGLLREIDEWVEATEAAFGKAISPTTGKAGTYAAVRAIERAAEAAARRASEPPKEKKTGKKPKKGLSEVVAEATPVEAPTPAVADSSTTEAVPVEATTAGPEEGATPPPQVEDTTVAAQEVATADAQAATDAKRAENQRQRREKLRAASGGRGRR